MKFDATYIGPNPLGDIMEVLSEMVDGSEGECSLTWGAEPGMLLLEICLNKEIAHLVVKESDDLWSRNPNKDSAGWTNRIEANLDFYSFVDVVIKEAERNLRLHGITGFSDDWMNHIDVFPMSAYLKLKGIRSEFKKGEDYRKSSPLKEELQLLQQLL